MNIWSNFVDLWNKSVYFRGAVVVFLTGFLMMLK